MKKISSCLCSFLIGVIVSSWFTTNKMHRKIKEKSDLSDKHLSMFLLMNQWTKLKQDNKMIATFFIERGHRKIAIYGMSYIGERLVNELEGSEVLVEYGIDSNVKSSKGNISVIAPNQTKNNVDAIVVTSSYYFQEIAKQLVEKVDCPIYDIQDIIFELQMGGEYD